MANFHKKFFTRKELSAITNLSVAFFEKHRDDGKAPPYTKLGGRVRYSVSDVLAWFETNRQDLGGKANG